MGRLDRRLDKLENRPGLAKPFVVVYQDHIDRPGYSLANGDLITPEQFDELENSSEVVLVQYVHKPYPDQA